MPHPAYSIQHPTDYPTDSTLLASVFYFVFTRCELFKIVFWKYQPTCFYPKNNLIFGLFRILIQKILLLFQKYFDPRKKKCVCRMSQMMIDVIHGWNHASLWELHADPLFRFSTSQVEQVIGYAVEVVLSLRSICWYAWIVFRPQCARIPGLSNTIKIT